MFEASCQRDGECVLPSIRGKAWVNARSELILDERDPLVWGLRR